MMDKFVDKFFKEKIIYKSKYTYHLLSLALGVVSWLKIRNKVKNLYKK